MPYYRPASASMVKGYNHRSLSYMIWMVGAFGVVVGRVGGKSGALLAREASHKAWLMSAKSRDSCWFHNASAYKDDAQMSVVETGAQLLESSGNRV